MSTSTESTTSPSTRADTLRNTALKFCNAFGAGASGSTCLDRFFVQTPTIIEHGPRFAADRLPFLGIPFHGRKKDSHEKEDTCDDYYDLLTSTLALAPGSLKVPAAQDMAVDAERGVVTVRLQATFSSVKTGSAWEEDFVYVLSQFDGEGRIGTQELWADPLSAWSAVGDGT